MVVAGPVDNGCTKLVEGCVKVDGLTRVVIITKKETIPTFQTIVVKGLTKVIGHCKHVHVLVDLSLKCQNIFIQGNTTELNPQESQVDVVLQSLSWRDVTMRPHTEVGMISAANKIPPMLAS